MLPCLAAAVPEARKIIMVEDKITQAKQEVRQIEWQRIKRISAFFILLVGIGLAGAYISALIFKEDDNFSWGFLTEMVGAAITLVIIEVAFQRSEENSTKAIRAWLDAASEEKDAAIKARNSAEDALNQLQQAMIRMEEELESAQQTASEYQSIAKKAMMSDLNKAFDSLSKVLDDYRMKSDPQYALQKLGKTLVSAQNHIPKMLFDIKRSKDTNDLAD